MCWIDTLQVSCQCHLRSHKLYFLAFTWTIWRRAAAKCFKTVVGSYWMYFTEVFNCKWGHTDMLIFVKMMKRVNFTNWYWGNGQLEFIWTLYFFKVHAIGILVKQIEYFRIRCLRHSLFIISQWTCLLLLSNYYYYFLSCHRKVDVKMLTSISEVMMFLF